MVRDRMSVAINH